MTRLLTMLLAAATLSTTPAAASGLSFGVASTFDVQLVAGGGRYDGTQNAVWVRVHSEQQNTWSGWRIIDGLDRGAVSSTQFSLSSSFGDVDEVDVYIGPDDGARITVLVDDGNTSTLFTPESKWVKGRTVRFDDSLVVAATCCTDPTGGTGCGTFEGDTCPDGLTLCWGDCGAE